MGNKAQLRFVSPINHIDADARDMLLSAVRDYSGIGILVSAGQS